jgi:hypothetical protein
MAKIKEPQIYWKVGTKGEKHEIPSGAKVVLEQPKQNIRVECNLTEDGVNVVEKVK